MLAATEERAAVAEQFPSLAQVNREMARRHHLEFMQLCWQRPGSPLIVGSHTRAICDEVDDAIARFRSGESSFVVVMVPFRHGKSDLISRYLPPKFLGEFPDNEVLLATYGAELASDLSRFARRIMDSQEYGAIFPGIGVAKDSSAADRWGIQGHTGGMAAQGLGGAMTGRGYSLGIVDDFLKNRAEAESRLVRDRIWDSFTNDFLTRRAPVSITFVVATPWHVDDIIGRVQRVMQEDASFPRFKVIRFPAFDESYPGGVLFPERFPREWYESQRAALGSYGSAALLQCRPTVRAGAVLKVGKIQLHANLDEFPKSLRWGRGWDLASTVKDLLKPDPDWTVGMKGAVEWRRDEIGTLVPHIWIADEIRGRWEAPERDRRIVSAAKADGAGCRVGTESVAGYKDTFTRLRELLAGVASVFPIVPAGDKLVRVSPLEPIFEAGNVHLLRADWNDEFIAECADFPSGEHDDQVDALSTLWQLLTGAKPWGVM